MLLSEGSHGILDCVKFGATYYGTDRMESAILFNNAPEPIDFVVILEEDAVGQEAVSLEQVDTVYQLWAKVNFSVNFL